MTERELQLLGFEQKIQNDPNWGIFYYYTYEVTKGLDFISNASDEIKEGGEWYVEFFESDPSIRFYEFAKLQALINLLEKHKVKEDNSK